MFGLSYPVFCALEREFYSAIPNTTFILKTNFLSLNVCDVGHEKSVIALLRAGI
jgi:hypothetical protein